MKEYPISFNDEMVRAIVEGRKTQTRRPLKPQPDIGKADWRNEGWTWTKYMGYPCGHGVPISPYGGSGDRLFIKSEPSIILEIKRVLVKQLHDMTAEDSKAEGCVLPKKIGYEQFGKSMYLPVFKNLWDTIYAEKGFAWDTNPFVWVIEFERVL